MPGKIDFSLDMGKVGAYLARQKSNIDADGVPRAAVSATKKVMFKWQELASQGEAGAPLDTGLLRSSFSVGVQGRFEGRSKNIFNGQGGKSVVINHDFQKNGKFQIIAQIGANTDYAAKVHENIQVGRKAGRGKFIEANGRENAKKWGAFIAQEIKRSLESA